MLIRIVKYNLQVEEFWWLKKFLELEEVKILLDGDYQKANLLVSKVDLGIIKILLKIFEWSVAIKGNVRCNKDARNAKNRILSIIAL